MKKKILSVLTAFSMLFATVASATEIRRVELSAEKSEQVTLIVEVEGDVLLTEGALSSYAVPQKQEEIIKSRTRVMSELNEEVDDDAEMGYVYTALFNGFSIETDSSNIDAIKEIDGIKNVYIAGKSRIIEPYLESSTDMIGAPVSYESGYKGEGMAVAIIDAGCDTGHEFFQAAPTNPKYSKSEMASKISSGTLSSGVKDVNRVYKNEKIPYAYNYPYKTADTYLTGQNHGTHVAGIVAGKNGTLADGTEFSGIAPEAQLFVMSCGHDNGSIDDEAVVAAINDAVLLGADVINMSFGIDYNDSAGYFSYKDLLQKVRNAGIVVMAASGNASRGFYDKTPLTTNTDYSSSGVPALDSNVTAVASANNTSMRRSYWSVKNEKGDEFKIYATHTGTHLPSVLYSNAYTEYVYCGLGTAAEFAQVNVKGKIALVKRGSLDFTAKAQNALSAGAKGIIIANTDENTLNCAERLCLPAACTTASVCETMIASTNKKMMYVGVKQEVIKNSDGGQVSEFSSWGVDSSLQLKPEITAPGGYICSSVNGGSYAVMSGTSMATPHMSGVAALAMQYYKSNPFADGYNNLTGSSKVNLIENILMNSADIIRNSAGVAASPRQQGAGLVNLENMLKSSVIIEGDSGKAKLSLGDQVTNVIDINFKITNISNEVITFDNISAEIMTDGYIKSGEEYLVSDTVSLDIVSDTLPQSVTIVPGGTYSFSGTVCLDKTALEENKKIFTNGFYIDGFIILKNESQKASIPLVGYYGDWGEAPVFDSTIYDEGGSALLIPGYEDITGTYLSMGIEDKEVIMGKKLWFDGICDKKYIAFPAASGATLYMNITNHRAMTNWSFQIKNSSGRIFYRTIPATFMANKYMPLANTFQPAYTTNLPEGEYSVIITANAMGDTDIVHSLSIPMTVDNTPPQVYDADYDREKKTVSVSAKDNHYISTIYAKYTGANEKTVTKYGQIADADYAKGESQTVTLDISDITDEESLIVGACDYATHGTYYAIDYFEDTVGAEIVCLSRTDKETSVTFNVRNNSGGEVNKKFAVAFYNEGNALVAMDYQNVTLSIGEEEPISYSIAKDVREATYAKLFVWEWNKLAPYDDAKVFVLN